MADRYNCTVQFRSRDEYLKLKALAAATGMVIGDLLVEMVGAECKRRGITIQPKKHK